MTMEQGPNRNLEFFFKRRLDDPAAFVREFEEIRKIQSRRSRRTTAHTIFSILVKDSRIHRKMYIRASVNGLHLGSEDKTSVFPGCFLVLDYDSVLDPDGVSIIDVEFLDEQDAVIFGRRLEIPNKETSRTNVSIKMTYGENDEFVELDVYQIKADLSTGGVCEDCSVIGHRGCGMNGLETTDMEENTISSFREAYIRGAKWVELDVQLTKDGIPVIFHDFRVRTEDGHRDIDKITLHEFLSLVGNQNEDDYTLPCTLEKVLDSVDHDLGINIEMKFPSPQYIIEHGYTASAEELVQRVVETVQRKGRDKIIFSSFHPYVLFLLKLRLPNFSTYMLTEANGDGSIPYIGSMYEALYFCTKFGLDGVALDWDHMSDNPSEIIQIFKEFGVEVMVYGTRVNIKENLDVLISAGVRGIIADDLKLICSILCKEALPTFPALHDPNDIVLSQK